ncbi:MAG: hypothetical protein AAF530_23795, partial [Pseudomonadota bacterium]
PRHSPPFFSFCCFRGASVVGWMGMVQKRITPLSDCFSGVYVGCGGRIRTCDLQVMSLSSDDCSALKDFDLLLYHIDII